MRALRTLNPGEKSMKKFMARDREPLFRVRYRYDPAQRKRFTTVELMVEEATPPQTPTVVRLRVVRVEFEGQRPVNQAGGKWNPLQRRWEIRYDKAVVLELTSRIVPEERSIRRKPNRSK